MITIIIILVLFFVSYRAFVTKAATVFCILYVSRREMVSNLFFLSPQLASLLVSYHRSSVLETPFLSLNLSSLCVAGDYAWSSFIFFLP
jgi:hypothetical protein